ncbi:ubiquinone anaerobic biosynthesis accessory factor UbiT [Castellaniella caeni]|uniref:ubiquinone anaerobic biosynthesis accessory factor UbiT n=1 Tax=Castellaniella caeni TaxID=266123 RepID=UPI00082ABE7A|nr:SCP2 sterol-binding domain-containing protein [Castellaniella caeni]
MQTSSSSSSFRVPETVAQVLERLPRYPGSLLFVAGLNLMLARHLHPDTLHLLEGRSLRIHVADARLRFDYTWRQGAFRAAQHGDAEPDLTIRADVHDFYQLIQRREDPDTLFFSRRLVIEGDTELGLMVKNTLDAIDMAVFHPKAVLRDLTQGLKSRLAPQPRGHSA